MEILQRMVEGSDFVRERYYFSFLHGFIERFPLSTVFAASIKLVCCFFHFHLSQVIFLFPL